MNPLRITERLQEALVSYLMTTFDVNRDGQNAELYNQIYDSLKAPNALFNGPFLELAPPYKRGRTLLDLIAEGVLDRRLAELPCFRQKKPLPLDAPLYTHQEAAIRRISGEGRGVVVSSGTGSGKTESFLIPILNDLLIDDSQGVRAVLIYPLNALVNDQLDRLRELLQGTKITFGRYTSELENSTKDALNEMEEQGIKALPNEIISREQIRKENRLPQILITNYAMLEYLLLRPQDDVLFRSGAWRFLVLDEAHSYGGAKGIEISMLVRRLKLRLNKQKGEMRCIATSATLVNDDREAAQRFAQNLFGEAYAPEDIILGHHDEDSLLHEGRSDHTPPSAACYNDLAITDLLRQLHEGQAQASDVFEALRRAGWPEPPLKADLSSHTASSALYAALRHNQHLQDLLWWILVDRQGQPVVLSEAARQVFETEGLSEHEQLDALHHLVELGLQARPTEDSAPLLPARYHLFARPSQGLWACLNPKCSGREGISSEAPWSKLYSTPHVTCDLCGCAVYPLVICRTCGQVYVRGEEDSEGKLQSSISPMQSLKDRQPRYFTWSRARHNRELGETEDADDEAEAPQASGKSVQLVDEEVTLCMNDSCRRARRCQCPSPAKVTLYCIDEETKDKMGSQRKPVELLHQCYRCQTKARIEGEEIATPLQVTGSTPLGVLVSEMYRNLPPSPKPEQRDKPGEGRKLLSFYDSRQGAARFAAFLQDVFNQDLYLTIVPEATRRLEGKHQSAIDFLEVSEECVDIGWDELRVFQNDQTLDDISRSGRLSSSDRRRLTTIVRKRMLAELSVNRRSRQSLESLGLLAVEYFETPPDVDELAKSSGLSADQVRLLARYLLDSLRQDKVVELPEGVEADDRVFGSNKGHPRVVRSNPRNGEVPWAGQTTRHKRYRIAERILRGLGKPTDEARVRALLDGLWDLVRREVLHEASNGAYRLPLNRLFLTTRATWYRCQSCQRLSHDAAILPCPHCGDNMKPADMEELRRQDYYYQVLSAPLRPLRVEEHTAQLKPEQGRLYQNLFKQGDINILSCSTTFEMGIDLGDLQAVFLNNVPPSVANYRQRAGRAGRRAGGAAMIVTWATDRPHDQIYFTDPSSIIRGAVRAPRIHLTNHEIGRRHVYAILLSEFLRYCYQKDRTELNTLDPFFNSQMLGNPHINELLPWTKNQRQALGRLLERYKVGLDFEITEAVIDDFVRVMERQQQRYSETRTQYEQAMKQSSDQRDFDAAKDYKRLMDRLAAEELIDHLSNRGVLPSYSFPLEVVELEILPSEQERHPLRLQRDLRQAIREYAPGAEVVANKRLWTSSAVNFYRDTPLIYDYRLCKECSHLEVAEAAGVQISLTQCPICGKAYGGESAGQYLVPDGFRAIKPSKAATQYVKPAPSNIHTALYLKANPSSELRPLGQIVSLDYSREGRLYFLNEGERGGFRLCMRCGQVAGPKHKACEEKYRGQACGSPDIKTLSLGHAITTDTLQIRLHNTADLSVPRSKDFLYSVLYALIQGACRALQIERQDIDGLLYPFRPFADRDDYEISIVLYDNAPGGAGHVKDIQQNFARVVDEAYQIISSCDCAPNTSCVRCLRDYNNQLVYDYLRRDGAVEFLERLSLALKQDKSRGFLEVKPANALVWLKQHLEEARGELYLAAEAITSDPISGQRESWIDLLRDLLSRDIRVTLLLNQDFDLSKREHLVTSRHLQSLLLKHGSLRLLRGPLPGWPILIQDDNNMWRAIKLCDGVLRLDGNPIHSVLRTSRHPDIIQQARADFQRAEAQAQPLHARDLEPPPNTRVYDVPRRAKLRESDLEALRDDFFKKPVRRMTISDPYLIDHERLFKRVSAYIDLANQHGTLERVLIITRDAGKQGRQAQTEAAHKLMQRYPFVKVERPESVPHDRQINVDYVDGSKARLLLGRGLDFIRTDGSSEPTYLVVQELS
ncbi:MAG: DEAD/DEAH box helicase [Anaerolineae bacterium]|nr:DEAD/DEAH box helicase [Anaerolineae bacterium]MDW8171274.1 DEAD/DEAH box helicase [Anaerolineae bacterium]